MALGHNIDVGLIMAMHSSAMLQLPRPAAQFRSDAAAAALGQCLQRHPALQHRIGECSSRRLVRAKAVPQGFGSNRAISWLEIHTHRLRRPSQEQLLAAMAPTHVPPAISELGVMGRRRQQRQILGTATELSSQLLTNHSAGSPKDQTPALR